MSEPSPISNETVRQMYRLVLEREPESEAILELHSRECRSITELRERLLRSQEYRDKWHTRVGPALLGSEPALPIEVDVPEKRLAALVAHIEDVWREFGETEPHFSVLTEDQYRPDQLEEARSNFELSGRNSANQFHETLARNGLELPASPVALEYGCGVGRVTRWLAERFRRVHACDISRSHLAVAERELAAAGVDNVQFHEVSTLAALDDLPDVDAFFTTIVLQHNPPPVMARVLDRLLRALRPGGVGFFQIPTYMAGYRFVLKEYLRGAYAEREMEVHVLPQRKVFELVDQAGAAVIEVFEDDWLGSKAGQVSQTFVVQRRR